MRTIFRYWLWVFLALIVLQIAFAGYGAFDVAHNTDGGTVDEKSFEDSFGLHAGFGYLALLGGLLTVILALVARAGRPRVMHSVVIFVLLIVQLLLAWFGFEIPVIGSLHPLNAFLILGAVGALTMREWRGDGMGRTTEPVAPPPSPAA